MSASLVGSEMCIRDRYRCWHERQIQKGTDHVLPKVLQGFSARRCPGSEGGTQTSSTGLRNPASQAGRGPLRPG
eukprot:9555369-Alexandrium_andersonii.AAC.1